MATLLIQLILFSLFAGSWQYDLGQTYGCDYTSTVKADDIQHGGESVHQISAQCEITPVWQDPADSEHYIIRIQVRESKLLAGAKPQDDLREHQSALSGLLSNPLYVDITGGHVNHVWTTDDEPSPTLAIKKAVTSFLQYQLESSHKTEEDVSGRCDVQYTRNGWFVHKVKTNCNNNNKTELQNQQVVGVSLRSYRSGKIELRRDQAMIQSAVSSESHAVIVDGLGHAGTVLETKQSLIVTSESDGTEHVVTAATTEDAILQLQKLFSSPLKQQRLTGQTETVPCARNCQTLEQIVKSLRKEEERSSAITLKKTMLFMRLVSKLRQVNQEEIKKIFKDKRNTLILPIVVEAVAATNKPTTIVSVLTRLDFKGSVQAIDLQERFLLALSMTSQPSPHIISAIINITSSEIPSTKLEETVLLTLGTLANKLSAIDPNHQVIKKVITLLTDKLSKCSDEPCKLMCLRALKNLASPQTLDVLLEFLRQSSKLVVEALFALQKIPAQYVNEKVVSELEAIYHQVYKQQSSTPRTLAAEILLASNPSRDVIERMLRSLSHHESNEVDTFLLIKLRQLIAKDDKIRFTVRSLLKDPSIANYDTLIPGGHSTVFTHSLTESDNLNSSYSFAMELAPGGVMKRSDFDINVNGKHDFLNILRFGLFTGGLAGIAGAESDEPEGEEQDATGGIKLVILGSTVRPYVFFTGQGELMSLVWSGEGSDITNIIQGNYVLLDHQQAIPLQNGFVAQSNILGAISVDISGSVEFSLWNRNAKALITNSASVVVQGSTYLDTSLVSFGGEFTLASEGNMNFNSDMEFAGEPFKMCTRMTQPPLNVKYNRKILLKIIGHKFTQQRLRRLTTARQGKSFFLHSKISQMCSAMDL